MECSDQLGYNGGTFGVRVSSHINNPNPNHKHITETMRYIHSTDAYTETSMVKLD